MSSLEKFFQQEVFAVAGSFRNKSKYAYKVLLDLIGRDKKAYPVNPKGGKVEGLNVYKSVKDIPRQVEAVSIVTPPAVTEKVVGDCAGAGVKYVWMQPGAESEKAVQFCRDKGIEVVYRACLLQM
ncbi:MAG: CoA-binding protein [Elusimicrobiota bacterium]|nr:CoA-binding protein [Elusimicrobiota bacterium]